MSDFDRRTQMEDVGSCPFCGYRPDAHTSVGKVRDHAVTEGAVSICMRCGEVAVFTRPSARSSKWMLRKPTAEEAALVAKDPTLIHALRAWKFVKGRSPS